MKRKELFQKTTKILVDAFLNDKLTAGSCSACAVGNICGGNSAWSDLFYTAPGKKQHFNSRSLGRDYVMKVINSTGYHYKELMKIEYAFEANTDIDSLSYSLEDKKDILEDQFNGLMAVIDVLMEIHECKDPIEKENFKQQLLTKF